MNRGQGDERTFVGRSDPDIDAIAENDLAPLIAAIRVLDCNAVYVSPLNRCRQTADSIGRGVTLPPARRDERLIEIDYGRCDGFTAAEAKRAWPEMFAAWSRGEDPKFPGGECTADVWARISAFADEVWRKSSGDTVTCTHNVVLRCLVGHGLGVPPSRWHQIQVPHLAPITIVQTRDHGWFVDLDETIEARVLTGFLRCSEETT